MVQLVGFLCSAVLLLACGPADPLDTLAKEHQGDRGDLVGAVRLAEDADPHGGREVTYGRLEQTRLRGYLAEAGPGAPAVLVIHEWWGLNDNIRAQARQLAAEGYTALAVDLYEGQATSSALEARLLVARAQHRPERLEENLRQAHAWLREAGAPRIGVIGWCFGGGWSLRTALLLQDRIDASVVYYGHLVSDRRKLASLEAPLLGIFAGRDSSIPVAGVRRFEAALQDLGKTVTIRVYEEAGHGFANPSGSLYDEDAAVDAWQLTRGFLHEHLQP